MPRDLPLGNGRMLVTFDDEYRIRDLYYPFVGKENHVGGYYCRFGVYVDGRFTWVERAHGWTLELGYEPDTLVTRVVCRNETLGVTLTCSDCVDFHASLYVRRVEIANLRPQAREIRLFFHQDLRIAESDVGDTAAYDPATRSVVHYKGNRYFLVNLLANGEVGVHKWAIGQKGQPGKDGTWRDAEDDGNLSGSPIAQGAVDSVVAAHVPVAARGTSEVFYWIAAGPRWKGDWDGVKELNAKVVERGPASYLQRTRDYWRLWVSKEPIDFFDLSPDIVDLYRRSLLILRTQIDNGGAIIAANDSDITTFARDTYSYMWPRDGALVAHALDLAGYQEPPRRFFEFCADVMTPDGYLLHKYTPDRSLGSSWHPWIGPNGDGGAQTPQLPIQEDETALVIWALWKHFQRYRDIEDLRGLYGRLVKKAAAFLVSYREPTTKLPGPSYDLWEERRGILTFTCGSVIGGLHAAAQFATIFGECDLARRYETAAQEIRQGMDTHLWRPELGRFARMVRVPRRRDRGRYDHRRLALRRVRLRRLPARRSARRGDDEGDPRPALVQDRGRRRRALHQRLLPPGRQGHRDRARQPVVHLHDVAGAARDRAREDQRRPGAGAPDPELGRQAQEAPVGRAGRAGEPVHRRAAVGRAAHLVARDGGDAGAGVPGPLRGAGAQAPRQQAPLPQGAGIRAARARDSARPGDIERARKWAGHRARRRQRSRQRSRIIVGGHPGWTRRSGPAFAAPTHADPAAVICLPQARTAGEADRKRR